ncbi:hypothetical protein [Ensifer canadensis]
MPDDEFAENMVCATINAPHRAMSDTLLAYLAAHRPDRVVAFVFLTGSLASGESWRKRLIAEVRVREDGHRATNFVGIAEVATWIKVFRKHGPELARHGVEIAPTRPGVFTRPAA